MIQYVEPDYEEWVRKVGRAELAQRTRPLEPQSIIWPDVENTPRPVDEPLWKVWK